MAIYGGKVQTTPYQAPDYVPSVAAARELAMTRAQAIPNMISQVGDYFKQQKEKVNSVNTASKIAGLLEAKAPDLVPGISELKMTLDDQELPLSQRIAAAESLFGTMKTGFEVNQLINQNAMMNLRQQKLAAKTGGGGSGGGGSSSGGGADSSNINPFTGQPY